jgi:hypothetical protein
VEKLFSFSPDGRPSSAAEAIQELAAIRTPPQARRPDTTGKPALSNPLAPSASSKKKKAQPKEEPEDPEKPERAPFHRTQNFVIAMAAVGAVCLTIIVLALTGHLGGGGGSPAAKPNPFAKKKNEPAPVEKTIFRSNERGEIQEKVGKQISVTGTIERFAEDLQQDPRKPPLEGRFLLFKDAGPRDVMVFFDPAKSESAAFALKRKFVGQKIRATGTVTEIDGKLLLNMTSMNDIELTGDDPSPPPAPAN